MGLSFAKLWDRLFGKQDMRILMVSRHAKTLLLLVTLQRLL
jgi:hypothetical protein